MLGESFRLTATSALAVALALPPTVGAPQAHSGKTTTGCPDALAVSDHISGRRPSAAFKEMFSSEQGWETIWRCIGSGDRNWLRIASQMQGSLDGGAAQELQMAVARALERNPIGVLRLLKGGFSSVAAVCGLDGIEGDLPQHFQKAVATVERRRANVKLVTAGDLQTEKRQCLDWLDKLETEMRKNEQRWFVPR